MVAQQPCIQQLSSCRRCAACMHQRGVKRRARRASCMACTPAARIRAIPIEFWGPHRSGLHEMNACEVAFVSVTAASVVTIRLSCCSRAAAVFSGAQRAA